MTVQFAYPPFRMKAVEAARYCGMSDSAFHRAVQKGKMPAGRHDEGGTYWLRMELEAAMLDAEDERGQPETRPRHDFSKPI